jgi:predicted N-acetyltransferase YhbS
LIADDGLHDCLVEQLYARAFGPGRFAKAAARLREGNVCNRQKSVLAFQGDVLVGACRLWPIVGDNDVAALFLGPIAVDQSLRRAGLGQQLVSACLALVDAGPSQHVILVGDYAYFGKMGFECVPSGQVVMPGPVDPKRLLWRIHDANAPAPKGRLSVPRATTPQD